MNNRKTYLILTATITPEAGQVGLSIVDPKVRFSEYLNSLNFYYRCGRSLGVDGLIFVENSGFDLNLFSRKFPGEFIEWVSAPSTRLMGGVHRGYGEFLMIDYAFASSKYLLMMAGYDVVWKVSGRYVLHNLGRMIYFSPAEYGVYGDFNKNWIELSVISWTKDWYVRKIRPMLHMLKTDMAPEIVLPKIFFTEIADDIVVCRFAWRPFLVGQRGSGGGPYMTKTGVVKHYIAQIYNLFAGGFARLFRESPYGK